jgi:hypothetical protein
MALPDAGESRPTWFEGLESQGRVQWLRRNEKRAGQLARRDALPARVAPDTPLIACLRVGIRAFPSSILIETCIASNADYILDIGLDRNNQSSFGDFVKQVDHDPRAAGLH